MSKYHKIGIALLIIGILSFIFINKYSYTFRTDNCQLPHIEKEEGWCIGFTKKYADEIIENKSNGPLDQTKDCKYINAGIKCSGIKIKQLHIKS